MPVFATRQQVLPVILEKYQNYNACKLTSRRLPEDCDFIGIAPKVMDIGLDPFECETLISQASVFRSFCLKSIRLRKAED